MPPNWIKFKSFQYEPKYTGEAVDAAVNWLTAVAPSNVKKHPSVGEGTFDSLGNFAMFNSEGAPVNELYNQACHAYFSLYNYAKDFDTVALWTNTENYKTHQKFFNWFGKESFASQFVLAQTENGVVLSSDIPDSLMHFIAMMSRVARMFPEIHFTYFNDLVDKGVPPEIAYLSCFCVGKIKQGQEKSAFYPSDDHRATSCPGISGMKKFLNGEFYIDREDRMFRNNRDQACSKFIKGGTLQNDITSTPDLLATIMEARQKDNGGVSRPPNPFSNEKTIRHGQYTYKEVYEIALPYFNEKGYFNADSKQ